MEIDISQPMIQILAVLVHFWPVVLFVLGICASLRVTRHGGKWRMVGFGLFLGWGVMAILMLVLVVNMMSITGIIPMPYNLLAFGVIGLITGFLSILSLYRRYQHYRLEVQDQNSLVYLQEMDPHEFELQISDFFESLGYRTRPYEDRQDHGVDVIVYDGKGEKWIVQCKRYRGVVGEPILRDLLGTMVHEKASKAFLMTTGRISRKARIWIEDKPITVYEGEGLVQILKALKNKPRSGA